MAQKYTEARKAGNRKWDAANLDRLSIALPKGHKETIQAHAAARGESVNGFIGRAIGETMKRDSGGGTDSRANAAESVSGVGDPPTHSQSEIPTEAAQTLKEAKRMVRAAGDVILPSLLRESVAEASRATGETDDAFLWRAVSSQAEQDREKRKAAANASDAPQGILIPVVVSLVLGRTGTRGEGGKSGGRGRHGL